MTPHSSSCSPPPPSLLLLSPPPAVACYPCGNVADCLLLSFAGLFLCICCKWSNYFLFRISLLGFCFAFRSIFFLHFFPHSFFFLYFSKAFTRTKGFLVIWLRLEEQLERVLSQTTTMKGICGCCCLRLCCCRRLLLLLLLLFGDFAFLFVMLFAASVAAAAGFGGLAQAAFVLKNGSERRRSAHKNMHMHVQTCLCPYSYLWLHLYLCLYLCVQHTAD